MKLRQPLLEQRILVDGQWLKSLDREPNKCDVVITNLQFRSRMSLGMSWPSWLSFCLLQWFGLRLDNKVVVESVSGAELQHFQQQPGAFGIPLVVRVRVACLRLAWPLTGWYLSWRREVIVPALLSLPTLATVLALVWWLV